MMMSMMCVWCDHDDGRSGLVDGSWTSLQSRSRTVRTNNLHTHTHTHSGRPRRIIIVFDCVCVCMAVYDRIPHTVYTFEYMTERTRVYAFVLYAVNERHEHTHALLLVAKWYYYNLIEITATYVYKSQC